MGVQLGRGRSRRANGDINVTPFVDVVLVLLIIFMVTAPLMLQGMDVNLPETTTQPIRMPTAPLVLTVTKDGTYSLARQVIPKAELQTKLEAVFDARGSKEVFLRADEAAPYGVVVQAMAAARRAGATRLGIVTEEEH
ncbi:MAG: biopolymer transporter ExbD [Spirochaetaceae bacterium]|nr:biopolymer transporter ExbD [Myxococcales bacterium]MCB9724444.1 biopolymer transporter ExbD [Spirochaetaceae bacterium]HPG28299.1 biopolymer transporter ExbD [Myxococcota bacterium]